MKHFKQVLIVWFLLGVLINLNAQLAFDPINSNDSLTVYQWDPNSDYQKVSKKLLDDYVHSTLIHDHPDTLRVVPDEIWIRILGLESLSNEITKAFLKANKDYAVEQSKHLKLITHLTFEGPQDYSKIYELIPDDNAQARTMHRFIKKSLENILLREAMILQEIPFHNEAIQIKETLIRSLKELVGPERTKLLLKDSTRFLSSFPMMKPADQLHFHFQNQDNPTIWILLLEGLEERWTIRLNKMGKNGSVGSSFREHQDICLPDSVKSIMTQWRQNITNHYNLTKYKPPTIRHGSVKFRDNQIAELRNSKNKHEKNEGPYWDENVSFFYLPKKSMLDLQFPGLTLEESISPHFRSLFGIVTNQELNFLKSIYDDFQSRFEAIEIEHLKLIDPKTGTYEILPFIEKANALRQEWLDKLGEEFGQSKATLMNACLLSPIQLDHLKLANLHVDYIQKKVAKQSTQLHPYQVMQMNQWASWLHRGNKSIKLRVTPKIDEAGIEFFDIQCSQPKGQTLRFTTPPEKLPNQLRHLLFPMLNTAPKGAF